MIIPESKIKDYLEKSLKVQNTRMLIFITEEEKAALKSLSFSSGLSMTEIIRRSLYNTLND